MPKLLFIGGSMDGRQQEVEGYRTNVALRDSFIGRQHQITKVEVHQVSGDMERYDRKPIGNREVMVLEGLTFEDVVDKLLLGYHPGEAHEGKWERGIVVFTTGDPDKDEGVNVAMSYGKLVKLYCDGAQFEKATVVFRRPYHLLNA